MSEDDDRLAKLDGERIALGADDDGLLSDAPRDQLRCTGPHRPPCGAARGPSVLSTIEATLTSSVRRPGKTSLWAVPDSSQASGYAAGKGRLMEYAGLEQPAAQAAAFSRSRGGIPESADVR